MAKAKKEGGFKFEKALKRLEDIVSQLESGQVELEQALALHQEAAELLNRCHHLLDEAQKKIKRIARSDRGYDVQDIDIEETER